MPQSEDSRLRKLFRRFTGLFRSRSGARKEPEPPVDPYAYVTCTQKAPAIESQRCGRG